MGGITDTFSKCLDHQLIKFFLVFHLVQGISPTMENQKKGTLLFVGARPALEADGAVRKVAYRFSKKLIFDFVEILVKKPKKLRFDLIFFVPSIIDSTNE